MDLYISPHFDDVIFSLSNHIINNNNRKIVLTVFTKENNKIFNEISEEMYPYANYKKRIEEDKNAVNILEKCEYIHLGFYEELFRDNIDINILYKQIEKSVNEIILKKKIENIYIPLGVGRHTDHLIVYESLKNINVINKFFYYEFPYTTITMNRKIREIELLNKSNLITFKDIIQFYNSPIYQSCYYLLRILLIIKNLVIFYANYVKSIFIIGIGKQKYIEVTLNENKEDNIDKRLNLMLKYDTQIYPIFGLEINLKILLKNYKEKLLKIIK